MRKPWMKNLQSFRFNREGTMTVETARWQREANSRDAGCVVLSKESQRFDMDLRATLKKHGFTTYGEMHGA